MQVRLPLFFFCLWQISIFADSTCYWPNGSTVPYDFNYTPCIQTATGVDSACCASEDPCSTNGYCFGSAGYVYRGGCTDINWNADGCCPNCRNAAIGSFSNIIPCPINNGSYTQIFCCSEAAGTQAAAAGCCDTAAFNINGIPISPWLSRPGEAKASSKISQSRSANVSSTKIPSTSTKLSSIPSGVTASTPFMTTLSVVATPLPQHSPAPKKVVDIGIAIGVPLGVLLISGLIGLLVHERRLRMKAQKAVDDTLAAWHQNREAKTPTGGYMLQDPVRPQEMEVTELQPAELYDGEVHEADVKTLNYRSGPLQ